MVKHGALSKSHVYQLLRSNDARVRRHVPTIGETVSGYEVNVWNGIVSPKGTPSEVIDMLNRAVNAVLAEPRLKARFAELGGEAMPMTPAEFGKLAAAETAKWAKLIRSANIKPE
jgi:tripartite-type tricarboxylate transporter receptor subunit TctC